MSVALYFPHPLPWRHSLHIMLTKACVLVRVVAQEVSRWLPIAAAQDRALVRSCGICDGQSWVELSYGRRSVLQFVLVSGSPLGPWPHFILILSWWQLLCCSSCRAPSLTRGRVCNLQCNRWLVRSLRTNNHTLPSHLRPCSLFVASYGSQGLWWRYSNTPPHRVPLC
jgi:hypothetical protein